MKNIIRRIHTLFMREIRALEILTLANHSVFLLNSVIHTKIPQNG